MLPFDELCELYFDDYLALTCLSLNIKSNGFSSNKKFRRTEKWIKFSIDYKPNIKLLLRLYEWMKIFKFLYDIQTEDIDECEYFSISLTSGNKIIYLKPAKKILNSYLYFSQMIEESDFQVGDEIEFRVEVTRNILERHICESH